MLSIELLPERGGEEIEELFRLAWIQRQWRMYLELVKCWHRPEEEALRWSEHRSYKWPRGHRENRTEGVEL
jgi:hypothetical protein